MHRALCTTRYVTENPRGQADDQTDNHTAITDKLRDFLDGFAKNHLRTTRRPDLPLEITAWKTDDHYATKRTNGRDYKTVPPIRTDERQKLPGKTDEQRQTTTKRKRWTTATANYGAATRDYCLNSLTPAKGA